MPSQLHKVTKKLKRKKRDVTSLHENSRDAKRLRNAVNRDAKIIKFGETRGKMNETFLDRVRYFQNAAVASTEAQRLDAQGLHALAEEYIRSYEPELNDLQAARRPGRPASTREDLLKGKIESEKKEFGVGYWVPDMRDLENVERLREWDGDWASLGVFKFVRVDSKGEIRQSRWPPNGMS